MSLKARSDRTARKRPMGDRNEAAQCATKKSRDGKAMITDIYFLHTNTNSNHMKQAFASLPTSTFKPLWVKMHEVKNFIRPGLEKPKHKPILIVDSIESSEFSNLEAADLVDCFRIFTPSALISVNPKRIAHLPVRNHPIISTCMKNLQITTSGLDQNLKREIKNRVRLMGGIYSKDLKEKSDYLVATRWDSPKALCYRNHERPIMTPQWVQRCWEKREIEDCTKDDELNNLRLKPFSGMVICVSGIPDRERDRVKKMTPENGGEYSKGLVLLSYRFDGESTQLGGQPERKLTTHLIVQEKRGTKYESAMEDESVKIVNMDWFNNSLFSGFPKNEEESQYCMRDPVVLGRIREKRKAQKRKELLFESQLVERDNEVMESSCPLAPPAPPPPTPLTFDQIVGEMNNLITVSAVITNKIFDGLTFHLCGLPSNLHANLKKLVSAYGGVVYPVLNAAVTHVIIGPNMTTREALNINRHDERTRFVSKVNLQWIVNSVKEGTLLAEILDQEAEKILGQINSTQDLDETDRDELLNERNLLQSHAVVEVMNKLQLAEPIDPKRNPNKNKANGDKRGFRMGAAPTSPILKLARKTKRPSDAQLSTPVDWETQSLHINNSK